MRKKITLFFLFMLCSGAFAKKIPVWIDNPYYGYDESKYICAVGSGSKSDDADKKSFADVASVLMQDINSVEVVRQSDSSEGKNLSLYLADITTNSDIKSISGLSVKDRYKDNKTGCFSRAVLDKSAAAKNYTLLLNKNTLEIETLTETAEKRFGTLDACKNLIKAYRLSKENDYYSGLLSVLKPAARHVFSYGSSAEVASKVSDAFSGIVVGVSVTGDVDGRIAAAASAAMSSYGFSTKMTFSDDGKIPYVFAANVSFEDIDKAEKSDIYFTRCIVSCVLTETAGEKNVLTYSANSRQGKLTRGEARQSAVRAAEKIVEQEFAQKFKPLFSE